KTTWQKLLEESSPIIDFTFDMVMAGLDLTKARDKTIAAGKLLPIIKQINSVIRKAHYLQKLSRLVNIDERTLETAMKNIVTSPGRGAMVKPKPASVTLPAASSPLEYYCLALLLQHPELKSYHGQLLPDYFENIENRETFIALREAKEVT
ncbi:MAG: hypothetical protein MUO90_00725, partial [Dehalococcoidales bacterium]|nr:hypothetical protein [Dehalococcoidales bacterium]